MKGLEGDSEDVTTAGDSSIRPKRQMLALEHSIFGERTLGLASGSDEQSSSEPLRNTFVAAFKAHARGNRLVPGGDSNPTRFLDANFSPLDYA